MQPSSPLTPHPSAQAIAQSDSPGVRIPPPIFYIAAFLAGVALQSKLPLPFLPHPIALGVGGVLAVAGAVVSLTAVPTMLRGHGTLNTNGPSRQLVTSGPYRYSRNPMYLGLTLLFGGLAIAFALVWAIVLLIPVVCYTQVGVILPEERYLARTFGATYQVYKTRVRRWL